MTPTNKSADAVVEQMENIDKSIPIVRVYRRSDEESELRKGTSPEDIVDLGEETLEISIIMALRKEGRDKVFGKSSYSLARIMLNRALSNVDGEVLVSYQPKDDPEPTLVDIWKNVREFAARLADPDNQYHTWSPEDKALYGFCCRHTNAAVIKDARFVVVTANNAGSKVVASNFGVDVKFIAVLCDEAAMIKEPDQWIPLIKLKECKKIAVV